MPCHPMWPTRKTPRFLELLHRSSPRNRLRNRGDETILALKRVKPAGRAISLTYNAIFLSISRLMSNRRSSSPSDNTGNDKLRCKWEGCRYKGTFERETSLIRHIRKLHISPLAHPCLVPGCSKAFNRADNLTQHTRNTHYSY